MRRGALYSSLSLCCCSFPWGSSRGAHIVLSQGKSHLCGEAKVLSEEILIYPERSLNALLRVLDRSTCLTSKKERRSTGDTLLNDVEKNV